MAEPQGIRIDRLIEASSLGTPEAWAARATISDAHAASLVARSMPDTIALMPDKPLTPHSTFRIPLDLKKAAAEKAAAEGKTLTDVITEALARYVKAKKK